MESNNIILDILKNKYKNIENLNKCKVLEIGCGVGTMAITICLFFKKYTAIDINNNAIIKAKLNKHVLYKNLEFKNENIMDNNYKLKKYNIIISKNCIHFIDDFKKFFNKINMILVKNGIFIIMEPHIRPKNWLDDALNEDSNKFDIKKWNLKKTQLVIEHEYIMNNLNPEYYEYNICRVYIIEK